MTADEDPIGEVIVGVDTHADQHTAVAINGIGQVQDTIEIPTTVAGFRQLVRWARGLGVSSGPVSRAAAHTGQDSAVISPRWV